MRKEKSKLLSTLDKILNIKYYIQEQANSYECPG